MSSMEENIDKKARQLAIDLQSLMARVDYIHNRHEECIVCHSKYKQHYPDGLPCESDDDKKDFCITHFFNPVRYMGLLEIVKEPINEKEKIDSLNLSTNFCSL